MKLQYFNFISNSIICGLMKSTYNHSLQMPTMTDIQVSFINLTIFLNFSLHLHVHLPYN